MDYERIGSVIKMDYTDEEIKQMLDITETITNMRLEGRPIENSWFANRLRIIDGHSYVLPDTETQALDELKADKDKKNKDLEDLKKAVDDITGAELGAYKVTGDRLDLLEQKVGLLLTHLGLQIEEDDD